MRVITIKFRSSLQYPLGLRDELAAREVEDEDGGAGGGRARVFGSMDDNNS